MKIIAIGFLNSFNNPDVDFDDERMESNEFSSNIDVMYLESLRAINEKIKACISCSEQECPIMKERMNRHIMQHHSFTNGERLSAQSGAHVYRNTSPKDDDTSPTSKYSKSLRNKIVEWSKDIPVYPNQIFEFKKQNLLNMLIENINDMSKNIDDEDYHLKLENVVNRFLNSLPGLNKEPLYGKLKDTLLDQIHMLNNIFFNDQTNNNQLSSSSTNKQDSVNRNTFGIQERSTSKEKNNIFFKPPETATEDVTLPYKMTSQENSFSTASGKRISDMKSAANNTNASTVDCHRADGSTKPEVKEVATNAPLDNIVNESSKQNTSTNTVIQYYNEVIGPDIILCDEAYNTNDLANVQVQVTKSIMNAIVVDDNSTSDIEEYSRIKKIFKDKVFGWMNGLMENRDYKFVNNKVDKNFIADVLWDELKPHVISKSTEKSNRMLKRRLLDVLDRMPLSTSRLDPVYKHQIAEDLYSRLLGMNYNDNDSKKYFVQNFNNCNIKDAMLDLQRDLKKILKKSFKSIGLDIPDNVQNEVALILLDSCNKNISNMRIKEKLFVFLKTLISLTTTETFDLINFIMEATKNYIKGIKYYESTSRTQNFGSLTFSGTLAVFPSEQELRGPTTSQKHKSAVKIQDNSNKSYDSTYLNNIIEIIRAWLDTLPKAFSSDEVQEENIQCLATEIYDQTQLEQLGEETKTESSKYKSFLIRKWLNKFDFFDDFSEAKPYIAHLVRELNDVRETESEKQQTKTIICCGTKSHISHPEYIMKNLILKFIEYNYLEDNLEVKSVFADLLKSELPNLSFPSRNEVYDTLQNKTDGISSFQRLDKELQYIIVIAECIQDVPLSDTFTNTKRNEIMNKLAQNMYVAENKLSDSTSMEDIIQKFVDELPISILPGYTEYFDNIVGDLIDKLINNRNSSPCCCFASTEKVNSSINVDTLSDYIESFIQENHQKLTENEIVLEACSLRLLNETNKLIKENPSAFDTAKVYERLGNADISNVQPIRRFSEEMKYAKDISDWLHNLPLLPVLNENDAINRTKQISELTHKIREYSECKKQDSNNSDIEANFKGYLENWLLSLPLDSRKEIVIPVVIQQLINRIARINNQIYKEEGNGPNIVCQAPVPCCSNAKIKKKQDPATVIVETIEKWCNDLPIEGETEKVNLLKDSIATKLYQKIGDINNNPTYFNDDILYKDVLLHEIDVLLSNVPPNDKLLNRQLHLKNKLVQTIMDNKKLLKQKISGGRYKKQLEDKIAMSIAENNTVSESEDPAFEIYKDRLATIFILDNFDHSNNAVKLKYENKIREDIDKYHKNALKRYTTAISKEQMFMDLYSALFDVSVPNEESLCEEIEEIKTKCEIQIWFEKLPLREATNFAELLQLDKILSMLAKKIHQIENTDPNLDDKLHKEITKWLRRLPLSPGKEAHVDQFASELNARLKSTFSMRKCVPQVNISKLIEKVNSRTTAVPRSENEVENALTTFSQIRPRQIKRPMDVIIETVQAWCNNLPLPANTPQEAVDIKAFKDSIGIKIILKISELNLNPEIFNDNFQYDSLLDDELEKVFDLLSPCCDAVKNKNNLKKQLIDAINSIKPIIYEENSRYKYKQDLKTVVTNSLGLSQPETEQKISNSKQNR
ncbi:unnamed protein product [Leptosia nina]|uniref:Uncharacterized protein n=1 Tax=Leptosia nina TaxID=320188 RepID=A0AAV1JI95_9NEOP